MSVVLDKTENDDRLIAALRLEVAALKRGGPGSGSGTAVGNGRGSPKGSPKTSTGAPSSASQVRSVLNVAAVYAFILLGTVQLLFT